ncbi:MAG: non-ribosomal peptide synthase/polyketide synthase [Dolichospermum sp. DEX182a]|nr:non-ribosomal peptide synthase/polyketide synthase [Dolichospermum sp. DEX182a]
MLQVFLQEAKVENCSCLRRVFCSGEALPFELTQNFFDKIECELHNLYGPTEAAIDVTYWPCQPQANLHIVPIGRPISNTQIYILDANQQPVPIGVPGELYIGGDGLARGYLNRPQLTQERFILNPFADAKSERLYKTGDLARYLTDGNIEYLGRIDNQVKIRGFRIELGEIEAVLNSHPQIQQTVVITTEDILGDKRLVAYIVKTDDSITTNQLREFLKQKLPEYMIPGTFVSLDTIPLTPNGKIDRKALPTPEGMVREVEYIAPRTPSEEMIANIFATVLNQQNVGIHDNFFTLGGHSLLATQLISRLRLAFSLEIPLRTVFESPTVMQLDVAIAQLRSQEQGLILPPIQPMEGEREQLPLSWAQERLWFLNQLEGASSTYNIPAAVKIAGDLNINALQQALSEIVHRHEILRTSIQTVNGTPIQVIHPQVTTRINVVDLQQLLDLERPTLLEQLILEEAIAPFSLENAPLIRCSLLQISAREYVLLLTMHHIVSDAWSMGLLISELSSLYIAFCAEVPSPLPALPLQYADFAVWQKRCLSGVVLATQLNYWRSQLQDAPPLLQLPTDRPRPVVQSYDGRTQSFELSRDLTQKLQNLSGESGTTLFMTMLAAFVTLLYRYSGQSDILVGTPIANRNRNEIESLIGFFVNTLVLRTNFADNPSFENLLAQVRETTLNAYEHQDVPFEQVVEALQPQRSLNHSPLFQVMFGLENIPMTEFELPGVTLTQLDRNSRIAKFDLTLSMSETEQGLVGLWEYNIDLFDGATIERMTAHFQNLLSAIVENPQQAVGELPLLSAAERHQLLVEWNHTAAEYPTDECIHQLFAAQVEKTPDAVAVVFENQQLTYRELNQRANQLGHYLQSLGVSSGMLVGICVERSVEMVVGLLGILKAGGAYVPLDPNYPQERLSYMLADSGLLVLLTQQQLIEKLPENNARLVCLDSDWNTINLESEENFHIELTGDELAYVIYTSGSTGQPKGVAVSHQAINRLVLNTNYVQLTSDDRIAQAANASFDAATFEIWGALLHGAILVGVTQSIVLSPPKFAAYLREQQISVLFLTTALFNQLANFVPEAFNSLRYLLFGGEAVDTIWVREFLQNSSPQQLLHVYGPTENTTFSSWFLVENVPATATTIPIGRPISNTQLYILDFHHQPVPIGVPGELYIGGDGLARGYLNRPELTLEKFIPNPFSDQPSARLYKTGDLARYLIDGNIEYISRIDNQVKIRGFRIELGEIEAVLNTHPHIQQAVVVVIEDIPSHKRIVAYVVQNERSLTSNQLREFLQQQLPEYMVPSTFVTLDTIPLTPNGKIDKKALPTPDSSVREIEYIAPRTPSEEIIANIFAKIINVQNVGIHDNFFILGGNSLLATQLISRLRLAFNREIPLRAVFESPTVTQLDIIITQLRSQEQGLILPPMQPIEGNREQLPLSWAQERLWFLNQLEGVSATYNIPVTVKIAGDLDINALQQALSEIVQRHEILRTSIQTVNGTPKQVIHPQVTTNINLVDLQQLLDLERETLLEQQIQLEAHRPFNLENAPLIRCSLLQISAREYVLLLTMHHIVSDGWSMGIFISELSSLYPAFCAGEPSPLPELPLQYADFAIWQRRWLSGIFLETQLNYWREQLQGSPELLQLPTDRPRPAVQTYDGRTQSFELNQDLTQKLQSLSGESGTTLFMTLFAAFTTLLYRYSGQSDILVGSPIANRNRNEIESLIGFFVNTLVLRSNFENNPSFESLLAQVRETTLQAYEHQDVPFEQVVEALQPQRSLSHSPLFQVMFGWENMPISEFELPGVTLTQLDGNSTIAKFDLTLSMSETDRGLVGEWEYNTDLFDGSTIERMTTHFQNLLSAIVANPAVTVDELALLSAAERHQLLVEWNHTAAEYATDKCVHQLFESQVERTPDAVAVVWENQQLTYQELNQQANQLAHHLQTLGVGPEVLVGICVERSLEMVVGLLGILKAGGAYVPLDPNYPPERLSYMLADSGVEVLLTENKWTSQLLEHQVKIICLDSDREKITLYNQKNPTAVNQGENLAYIIYTSGSTGQAKGVMITHQALSRFTQKAIAEYEITARDRVLQFASINFDAAVEEIYPCLCTGGTLILRTNEMIANLETFFLACVDLQLTVLDLPTAYWHQLVADMANADVALPASLRLVIVGGEKLLSAPVRYWQQYVDKLGKSDELRPTFGDRLQLINTYGPTETTVSATLYRIPFHISPADEVPIGSPLAGVKAYILDANQQPVPIGVPGELYIGGDGLARGYLNRPELTLEKFIPNPFSDQPSARLYKTGDLARYLIDGNIEYLGRIDNQVKIRGFRIELGEIEAVLNTHPHIQQTVVITIEDIPSNKTLVAYVVKNDESLTTNQLREFLQQKLPAYMMPSAFVTLDTIPLTPNGKIDKKALPIPDGVSREVEYIAPRTPSEEIIANIFATVLNQQNICINDNFFSLGGHSLLATQLISRLRLAFNVEIPLRAVFESPTVTQLDTTISQLRSQERGLILPPIQAIEGNREQLPLSWAQERLWFLNQLEGDSATYNIPEAVKIAGDLDINALQQALSEIVHRHEILRTSIQTVNGLPIQVIHPQVTTSINVVDLQQLLAPERETLLEQQIQLEASIPFNLENAPLIRCILLQVTDREYVLLLTMHHIVSDGWSMGIFISELSSLYPAFCAGEPSPLPELPLQYADFAVWQRRWLTGVVLETQLNYWREQLQDAPSLLKLPTDRPRPVVQTYNGRTQSFELSQNLTQKLQSLSGESGTTLFMTLLAAFTTLLYRYSGESDILLGTPIANRNHDQIESLIGFFVNTLVLRTNFANNPSFNNLLAQIRETTLQAYEHQDVPFEQVVEALQPQRSLSHSPLFQVMFILQNVPMNEVELPGVTLTQLDADSTIAKFDLTLSISETEQGLFGSWEYNTDLFDSSTIERMTTHFQNLLSAIVANPAVSVGELPLLSAAERHQLLVEWNQTVIEYPTDQCIHQLFESQVERTPDAVAVVFGNQQLTYRELNQQANQLAHYLQTLGVRPEVLVGICVERSLEMLVGLLGILKAGGAYVPLDPEYPRERLAYMLNDSQVQVLLTQADLLASLPDHQQIICLDTDWLFISSQTQSNPISGAISSNLAYVIYTSGSTGMPKGTAIIHQGVVNYLSWATQAYRVSEGTGAPVQSSLAFDATITSLFSPLLVGQKVVLLPQTQEIAALSAVLISESDFSLVKLTPAHLQLLAQLLPPQIIDQPTKALVIGGEALLGKNLAFWHNYAPNTRLFNEYGPTETVVGCCVYEVTHTTSLSESILIGRPIANTQLYILDQFAQPVPIGVPGELYIGGDGLARGYLNRPELTQEKFIPNPFSDHPSQRLYKTGDLARYLIDGNIEYLGRIDNQVKIRGFRIELGEIEAVLNAHPQIQQTVVITTEDIPGDKRLVAYVVKSDESLTNKQIRDFLKQQLPEYMLPSTFVTLDTIPLTPNGKIDKKALPTPYGMVRETEYIAPSTPNEEIIANIFARILNLQNIGINDNFFSLGGHSLLATQLISRLRLAFNIEIPLRTVFESPTVTQLDIIITQLRSQEQGLILPPMQPIEGNREQLPLSWAQERLWFLNQLEGVSATYNIPVTVKIAGDLDINALQQALSEIVQRHEILRTSIQTVNGTPKQVIHPQVTTNINLVDLQPLLDLERQTLLEQLILEAAIAPFSLENAPLIRCSLLQISAKEYLLLLTMHHIVSDGWSMGIFISELSSLYPAFCAGEPSPLPELPLQYADFAVWQRQRLSGVVLETQLNYWREQLQDAPSLLKLPTDRPRPVVQTYHGRTQSFELNQDLTQKLQSLSGESGTTLFMTLLAAFTTLLYRYSGESDILLGTPIANRNHDQIESLIGFFVNTLVLRTNFADNPSFNNLLAQIRETTLQAYEHQDVPFEQVVEALQPQRSLSHSPLFQVMFILQNVPMNEVELPGVTLTTLDADNTIAKFDLTLSISETEQGLFGSWEYNTDLFDSSTIERMTAHFQNLLSAIVANPAATVGELPLLSAAERHQLLVEWNDTAAEYPTDKCIHQLFEAQVEKTPDAVAVVFENQQLTYRELNQRANQLAHHLQTLGVRAEVLVGLCVERSLEMIIGLLGILKAGGAYVPLDPNYPPERLSYMLVDSGVEVLLTQQKLLLSLPPHPARVICLDDGVKIEPHNQENLETEISPTNLAYVIYTSGSTGQPKGVAIQHLSVCNLTQAQRNLFDVEATSRVLQFASVSFDASVWEIFMAITSGAMLILGTASELMPGDDLQQILDNHSVTHVTLPPSALAVLPTDEFPALGQIIVAGEACPLELVNQWSVGRRFFNAYGPTESTVCATVAPISHGSEKITIGRPINNTQIYILDLNHRPVPIGVPGELYIGGDGLARGYLNRPELTLAKFIPNPIGEGKSERLYKTGDSRSLFSRR